MSKIIVYCQYHIVNRAGPTILYNIALYLKNNYSAEIIFVNNNEFITIKNDKVLVLDCELLIYYPDEDKLKVLSYCDTDSPLTRFLYNRNKKDDLLIMAQQGNTEARWYNKNKQNFTLKGTTYIPQDNSISLDNFYVRRQLINKFKDKMVFRGNVKYLPRGTPEFLMDSPYFEGYDYIDNYFYEIIKYKVGLSIPGTGELCYRDVEYMAVGLPMLRFEYITPWNPKLIPNHHYISIDRIDVEVKDERIGSRLHANLYIKRFLEVKDDLEFLNFISKNARDYYMQNIHQLNIINKIIDLFEL